MSTIDELLSNTPDDPIPDDAASTEAPATEESDLGLSPELNPQDAWDEGEADDNQPSPPAKTLEQQLAEERGWRKRIAQELKETRESLTKLSSRAELMMQAQARGEEESEDEAPDPATDPVGFLTHEITSLKSQLKALHEAKKEQDTSASNQQAINAVMDDVRAACATFQTKTPDFTDAVNHLSQSREAELSMMGYKGAQLASLIQQDILQLAVQANASGMNVAEMIYTLAKQRGYSGKSGPGEKSKSPAPLSLNGLPGSSPRNKTSSIADMSDAEFEAFFKSQKRKG